MFSNIGLPELLVVLVLVLLLFGAKRLPEVAQGIGKAIRSFKKGISDVKTEIENPEKDPSNKE